MWGKRDDTRGERCHARKEKNAKSDMDSEQAFFLAKLLQSYLFLKFLTIFSVKCSLKSINVIFYQQFT